MTIYCISHTLSNTECQYCAVEKEALACLWAVEHFEKYLLGRHFTLHTEQHALQQILSSPAKAKSIWKTSKYLCWAERLSAHDFMIAYWKEENLVLDVLSRLLLSSEGPTVADGYVDCLVHQVQPHGITFSEIQFCTSTDNILIPVLYFVNTYWLSLLQRMPGIGVQ